MPVVELDIDIRLLVDQVISPSSWGQPHQFPEVTAQLVASRSLQFNKQKGKAEGVRQTRKLTVLKILGPNFQMLF